MGMSGGDISVSGFIPVGGDGVSNRFTDIQVLPTQGYSLVAKAKRYGRWWVLKGLKEPWRNDGAYVAMQRKEFDILIQMQHPAIVAAVGMEDVSGMGVCIVTEWVDGTTLKQWLSAGRRLKDKLAIALQVADALEYIHGRQTLHRDLKPSNILVTRNGRYAKLIDFGLSDRDDYAVYKQPAGTEGYMSPEQSSSRVTDVRNDIYSFGCVLADMKLGLAYCGVVRRCKAAAGRRYQSMTEVRRALIRRSHAVRNIFAVVVVSAVLSSFGALYVSRGSLVVENERTAAEADSARREVIALRSELGKTASALKAEERRNAEMRTAVDETSSVLDVEKHRKAKIEAAIGEGRRRMNAVVGRSGIGDVTTYAEFKKAYDKVTADVYYVFVDYAGGLDELDDVDRETVKHALASYYEELVKPLQAKFLDFKDGRGVCDDEAATGSE